MKALTSSLLVLCLLIHLVLAQPSHPNREEEPVYCDESDIITPVPLLPLRIAVIGAGPGGLFLCHALEKLIKKHGRMQDGRKIQVTAFEKSSHPGGLWQNKNSDAQVTIYDNLWTNGPSFLHEFHDYTYQEHFDRPVDVYFPRKDVLDYILARVQQNTTDFFEKYVKFDTEVLRVEFSDPDQVFQVTVKDLTTGAVTIGYYEKCIWAAGTESMPYMPADLKEDLEEFGFQGRVIHSSDMAHFEDDVKGKRILLVGGGLSTEDLVLQAIKCGVQKVYVAARDKFGPPISSTASWPENKVEVLLGWQLGSITEDGESLVLESVKRNGEYYATDATLEDDIFLDDVDTIIFCTGYDANMNMLEESLHKWTSADLGYEDIESPTLPEDWTMQENCMTSRLGGQVKPSWDLVYESGYNNPMLYRGVLISNPNMIYLLSTLGSETPLFSIDVSAHLFAGYIYGTIDLPTETEMQQANLERFHHMMHNPLNRMSADVAYSNAMDEWMETANSTELLNAAEEAILTSMYCFELYYLDKAMVDANYPVRLVGPDGLTCPRSFPKNNIEDNGEYFPLPQGLTKQGELFVSMDVFSGEHRALTGVPARKKSKPQSTFRDYTDGTKFRSLHTNEKARPSLHDMWMNL